MLSKAEMLLCPPAMGFARNQWYVAAFSSEVGQVPLARTLLGDPVVLFRDKEGAAVALADRCPHRGLPLSAGALEGGTLRCAYHGMRFDRSGACVEVPSQASAPPGMCVQSYPMVEKTVWIWIWMGDAALADPALIPDHAEIGIEREGYQVTEMFRMDIPGNYELLHENLLDVSHISFLHTGLLDDGSVGVARQQVKFAPDRVTIAREVEEIANEGTAFAFALEVGKRYRRTLTTWTKPPALTVIENIHVSVAEPDAPPRVLISPFGITPETMTTTHQFLVTTTSYHLDRPRAAVDFLKGVFEQDNVAIRAIQGLYEKTGRYAEVSVKADAAALRCRLRVAELIERETVAA